MAGSRCSTTRPSSSLPVASDPKAVTSIRQQLVSWHCGGRKPPRRLVAKKKGGAAAAQQAKAKAAKGASGGATPAGAVQAEAKVKSKPAAVVPDPPCRPSQRNSVWRAAGTRACSTQTISSSFLLKRGQPPGPAAGGPLSFRTCLALETTGRAGFGVPLCSGAACGAGASVAGGLSCDHAGVVSAPRPTRAAHVRLACLRIRASPAAASQGPSTQSLRRVESRRATVPEQDTAAKAWRCTAGHMLPARVCNWLPSCCGSEETNLGMGMAIEPEQDLTPTPCRSSPWPAFWRAGTGRSRRRSPSSSRPTTRSGVMRGAAGPGPAWPRPSAAGSRSGERSVRHSVFRAASRAPASRTS